jgi:putative transposase
MKRRVHSREFKLEVMRQVTTGEKRPAQICREYDLATSVLDRWRKEYEQRGESAFSEQVATEQEALERRIADLERFCEQLSWENAVLKRAMLLRSTTANERGYTEGERSQPQDGVIAFYARERG